MSNRFHQKNHRFAHHTYKNPSIPDAGWDPIASPDSPFMGTFAISGQISAIQINSTSPSLCFTNSTIVTTVTSTGMWLTVSVNGSALAIPLYQYTL